MMMRKILAALLAVIVMASAGLAAVDVRDFGDGVRLHSFGTGDNMNDYCYIVETPEGLVMIESTAYRPDVNAVNDYVKSLGKTVAGALLSYHPNGYRTYGVKVYATEPALKSWQEGGSVWGLTQSFIQAAGDKVAEDLPDSAEIINEGQTVRLAGVDFVILHESDGEGYGVAIPAMNAVYRHMLGSKTHNILPSREYIEAEISELNGYQSAGYTLILTSHNEPEASEAVNTKIAYLEKVLELSKTCKDKDDFTAKVNEAFPDYSGGVYLGMTAGALFSK